MNVKAVFLWPRAARRFLNRAGLTLALGARALAAEAHDPATELAALKILPGYEANLFASEKEGVVKPIQIRFAPDGKLWVVGSTVYPQIQPGEIPNDKVVTLEDTDGDGRADKSTVFAEGLMIPTGIELGHGGVYVGQANELLFLRDTDGDGRADERTTLLRGFGTGDSHQTINSFTWGPSGEMMMCQGLHALSRVETPWGIERLHSAGVWRFWPRLLRLDPFLNESMGPQNPFGVAFDRWGQPILLAGNGEGVYYLTPAMIRAQHHQPLRALWNTGRKFGGGDFVENSHFPPEAQGELISGCYIINSVYRFRVSEEGAGFRVEDLPPLITTTNTSFRIVDARFGPDGALYLCDWYNPVIGHYQASFRHPDRDKQHGRIWRVTAKGRALALRPKLENATVAEALDQLKSPERWNRQTAKRLLADRPAREVTNALERWTAALDRTDSNFEHHMTEALGVWASHEAPAAGPLRELLQAKDYRARAYATRVAGHWAGRLPDVLDVLSRQARDSHPRVRLEAVVAASYFADARAVEAALEVLDQPLDAFLEYALIQAIHTLKPQWREAFQAGRLAFGNRPERLEYFVKTDGSADTLEAVSERLKAADLSAAARESLLKILAESGGPDDLSRLLQPQSFMVAGAYDASLHARLLPALAITEKTRKLRPAGDLAEALRPLAKNPALRAEALRLAGVWRLEAWRGDLESAALEAAGTLAERRAALEGLGSLGGPASRAFFNDRWAAFPPELADAAIAALAANDLKEAAARAAAVLSAPLPDAQLSGVYSAFLQRKGGGATLASALGGQVVTRAAAAEGLRLMSASGRRDEQLAQILSKHAGFTSEGKALTPEEIASFAQEVKASGNARLGADIYARADLGCVACHAVNGQGGNIGPDLGSLGTSQQPDFIIGAILYPNREVKEGFMSIELTTTDGEEYQGYLAGETAGELVVRDVLRHQMNIRIRRDHIKERRQHGSVMPAGLADNLSREELRDLVKYLSNLGKISP